MGFQVSGVRCLKIRNLNTETFFTNPLAAGEARLNVLFPYFVCAVGPTFCRSLVGRTESPPYGQMSPRLPLFVFRLGQAEPLHERTFYVPLSTFRISLFRSLSSVQFFRVSGETAMVSCVSSISASRWMRTNAIMSSCHAGMISSPAWRSARFSSTALGGRRAGVG